MLDLNLLEGRMVISLCCGAKMFLSGPMTALLTSCFRRLRFEAILLWLMESALTLKLLSLDYERCSD